MAFTDGLLKLQKRLEARFYTTAITFAQDLSDVFRVGINTEPPAKSEGANISEHTSPSKKPVPDIKERKRLAKRIIKAVQPQLELATRAEADISNKPADKLLKDLEQLLESSLEASISVSLGEPVSLGDADAQDVDTEMADASRTTQNGVEHTNDDDASEHTTVPHVNAGTEFVDVDMEDIDAPGEEVDDIAAVSGPSEVGDTIDTAITAKALAEVNINVPQTKANHVNGIKNLNTPPGTNGYASAPENEQPTPPTPPVSNGGSNIENTEILTNGGVPWYLKDFQPVGTSIRDAPHLGEDRSNADEDELRGDINGDRDVLSMAAITSPSKAKKGKAKKKGKGR